MQAKLLLARMAPEASGAPNQLLPGPPGLQEPSLQAKVLLARMAPEASGAPKVWCCRHFCGPGGPKCGTVATFGALEAQSVVLSALLGPWCLKVWYCRHFWGPGSPKRGTVSPFRALGLQEPSLQAKVLLARMAPGAPEAPRSHPCKQNCCLQAWLLGAPGFRALEP